MDKREDGAAKFGGNPASKWPASAGHLRFSGQVPLRRAGGADVVADFPVRADDNIVGVYGIVDEDLDDAIRGVLATCGRQLLSDEVFERLGPVVIETVRDFALFVELCPRITEPAVTDASAKRR